MSLRDICVSTVADAIMLTGISAGTMKSFIVDGEQDSTVSGLRKGSSVFVCTSVGTEFLSEHLTLLDN